MLNLLNRCHFSNVNHQEEWHNNDMEASLPYISQAVLLPFHGSCDH